MTRKECLDKAAECVLKDRASQYGNVERNFERIADLWEAYLHAPISALDVAMMMALLKIARAKANPAHADSFVDLAGYAACGAECAAEAPSPAPKDGDELVVLWKHKPEAEGNYPENPDSSPEFKPGDKVDVHAATCRDIWEPAIVVETYGKEGFYRVEYSDGYRRLVPSSQVRPAPKAEGCEALVEKDAPQTTQELYQHIVDCNPATYGRAHKPTGEELAEMAEETRHE